MLSLKKKLSIKNTNDHVVKGVRKKKEKIEIFASVLCRIVRWVFSRNCSTKPGKDQTLQPNPTAHNPDGHDDPRKSIVAKR